MIPRNRPAPTIDAPTVQYANGKSYARFAPTAKTQPIVGFHSEVGRSEDFDRSLAEIKVHQIEIKHQRPGGSEMKLHWYFGEQIRFYPITAGPVATTVAGGIRRSADTANAGIGVRWGDGERSRLALRGFLSFEQPDSDQYVAPILQVVQLSVKSRMTDRLLGALIDHLRICEAADDMIDRAKHPDPVGLHELPMALGVGAEEDWGKGDTATVSPLVSLHPEKVTRDYVAGLWRTKTLHDAALHEWEGIVAWAQGYAVGTEEGNGHEL